MTKHFGPSAVHSECNLALTSSEELTNRLSEVTCFDCRKALARRGICPSCGEEKTKGGFPVLQWNTHPRKLAQVPDGMLRLSETETVFYLSCDYCSETVISQVEPGHVARVLTELRWVP